MADKDIISKTILKRLVLDMAKVLFKLKLTSAEIIETEYQCVEERRADLVAKVKEESGESILHVEIQNDNQGIMPWRMLRYLVEIKYNYQKLLVRQYLIYIGKNKLTMADGIRQDGLVYSYRIVDMHDVNCQSLIEQNTPEALVLAILCDFGEISKRDVVRLLLKQLHKLVAGKESKFREYLHMMEVLSTNRNLEEIVKEEEKMLSQIKNSQLPSYKIGWEDGVELGKQEGRQEGRQEGEKKGEKKGERSVLNHLIIKRFGKIPKTIEDEINHATSLQIEQWVDKVIEANNLEDLF
jgi:predicted transposase/invertase (TIGR01784 family)